MSVVIKYCDTDKLFSIEFNGNTIHRQSEKPNETEVIEALGSDNWLERFQDMRSGKKVRVSDRIYYEMLECVPPIKHTPNSFFNGEAYKGSLHYYFSVEDGKRYGQLKSIN